MPPAGYPAFLQYLQSGRVSTVNWSFHPLRLCNVPAGRTFIKLLRRAIDRIIDELEHSRGLARYCAATNSPTSKRSSASAPRAWRG